MMNKLPIYDVLLSVYTTIPVTIFGKMIGFIIETQNKINRLFNLLINKSKPI